MKEKEFSKYCFSLSGKEDALNRSSLEELQVLHDYLLSFGLTPDHKQHFCISTEDSEWYRLDIAFFANGLKLYIDHRNIITAFYLENDKPVAPGEEDATEFIRWITADLKRQMSELGENESYSDYLRANSSPLCNVGYITHEELNAISPDIRVTAIPQKYTLTKADWSLADPIHQILIHDYLRYDSTLNDFYVLYAAGCKACNYDVEGLSDKEIYLKYGAGRWADAIKDLDETKPGLLGKWAQFIQNGCVSCAYTAAENPTAPIDFRLCYDEIGIFISIECHHIQYSEAAIKFYFAAKEICDCFWFPAFEEMKSRIKNKHYVKLYPMRFRPESILYQSTSLFFDSCMYLPSLDAELAKKIIYAASWEVYPKLIEARPSHGTLLNDRQRLV